MNKFMLCACGALLAGVSMAAATEVSVTGNNTAVVIQKDVVKSKNNYQFLCIPVRGFDISGNKQVAATKLGELLPEDVTPVDTEVTVGAKTYKLCTVSGDPEGTPAKWHDTTTNELAGNTEFNHQTIFWVKTPKAAPVMVDGAVSFAETAKDSPFVFCGEETKGLTAINGDGVQAVGNAGSEPIDIYTEFSDTKKYVLPETGFAYIYVVRAGANDYRIYRYETVADGSRCWTRPPRRGEGFFRQRMKANDAFIAPGEAFYLQGVKKIVH